MSIRVFLSATFKDLEVERSIVIDVFRRLRVVDGLDVDLITMEDFGPYPDSVKRLSTDKLGTCHMYLVLMSRRYGTIEPSARLSYSEIEYEEACSIGLPVVALEKIDGFGIRDIETDPIKVGLLNNWQSRIRASVSPYPFSTPHDLGMSLAQYMPSIIEHEFPGTRFIDAKVRPEFTRYFQMDSVSKPFITARSSAKTLDIIAVTALSLFHTYSDALEALLRSGAKIRVVLMKADGEAARLVETIGGRKGFSASLKTAKDKARGIQERCRANGYPGQLQLKEMDWIFSSTIFMFDQKETEPICWVGTYTPDFSYSSKSKWFNELTAMSGSKALAFYADQFERVWLRAGDVA
ncbi:MAG TPA: DUF4062 domain-containing protein [Candidatus Acidoferrum sp.]|nr:DUF4062 domain-containing protein [Candidatus Acidoferrum sp.]